MVTFISAVSATLATCYNAVLTNQTRNQKRFSISRVAADWHALMTRPSRGALSIGFVTV